MNNNYPDDESAQAAPAKLPPTAGVLENLALALGEALLFFLPLGLIVAVGAVLAQIAVGSYAWSAKPLMPELSKIGVISGFKRLFSRQQLFEVLKLIGITVMLAAPSRKASGARNPPAAPSKSTRGFSSSA